MTALRVAAVLLCGLACGVKAPPRPPSLNTSPVPVAGSGATDAGPAPLGAPDAGLP